MPLAAAGLALARFADAYRAADPADTSAAERERLQRAYDLTQEALSCFS